MCGICGVVLRDSHAAPVIHDALKRLEYRGYDSAGIATIGDGKLYVKKDTGKIDEVHRKLNLSESPGTWGIGHTRWATHGGVTRENAHPHIDCSNTVAVAHNGIIENFLELKRQLYDHHFSSETDTEVIAHLLEEQINHGMDLREALRATAQRLSGSYAIVAISTKHPNRIAFARKESPLVLGLGENGIFCASDMLSFLPYTSDNNNGHKSEVVYIGENEVGEINPARYILQDTNTGEIIQREPRFVGMKPEISGNGYSHFMLKEIHEQGTTIRGALSQNGVELKRIVDILRGMRNIFILGSGTSHHAGLHAEYKLSELLPVQAKVASEFGYFKDLVRDRTGIIAVSQSGETADVLSALREVRCKDPYILAICNREGSSLTRESDDVLYTNSGPEIGVAATKSYTGQLAVLHLLYHSLKGDLEHGRRSMEAIADSVDGIIDRSMATLNELVAKYLSAKDWYFIGRGSNYPTAMEGALKLKEISYAHAEALAGGELKHGTLALIEKGVPCIVIAPRGMTYGAIISNAREIQARGGEIIGVSSEANDVFKHWIQTPDNPIAEIIPLQLLAYEMSVRRGYNPDMPRNLAKSVTVR